MTPVFRYYSRYFVVGTVTALVTIALREFVAYLLPSDDPTYYMVSVSAAYAIGILLSYVGHRVFSFPGSVAVGGTTASLAVFTSIALIGLVTTTFLAAAIRYGLPLERILGALEPTIAFAAATFLSSIITYLLNARYTFIAVDSGAS